MCKNLKFMRHALITSPQLPAAKSLRVISSFRVLIVLSICRVIWGWGEGKRLLTDCRHPILFEETKVSLSIPQPSLHIQALESVPGVKGVGLMWESKKKC